MFKILFHKKSILLSSILFLSFAAFSQNDSINYDSLASLPLKDILELKVSGVSKYEETSEKAPASVIVISKKQIKENGYNDLSDVLENVIGIDAIDNARGFGEYYTIRGIGGNDRFLLLIDGQKINPASGTSLSIGNSISIKFAKRIEIIFGPTSAIYGADAFSGIINIVSKDVKDKVCLAANIEYGTANTVNTNISTHYSTKKGIHFYFSGHLYKSDGPNFIGRDTVYDIIKLYKPPYKNDFEQPINDHTIFLKTKYKNVSFSYFRQGFNEGNALGMETKLYIYNKENKWKFNNNIAWLSYNKKLSKRCSISADITYLNFTLNPETKFLKWINPDELTESYSQYMTGIDNTLKTTIIYNYSLLNKLRIISGIEYEFTNSIPPYANDQILGSALKFEGDVANIIKRELTINDQRIATFSQINYSILKKLDIVIGGRIDYSIRNKETFNPRLSLIFNSNINTSVKFLYGRAFQAPSLFYQYEQFGTPNAVMLSVDEIQKTNPRWRLKNQVVNTFEFNINRKLLKNINVNISAYHSFLSNLIKRNIYSDSVYNKYFSTQDSAYYTIGIRNENIGNASIYGINFKLETNITKKIHSCIGYSFVKDGSPLNKYEKNVTNMSTHKLWVKIMYLNILNHFNLSSNIKYIGKINNNNLIVFPTGKQNGFFNIDMHIRTSIIKNTTFYVKINNLLNSKHSQSGILEGVVFLPSIPQNGFMIHAGMELFLQKNNK